MYLSRGVSVKLLRQACSTGSAGRPQGSAPLQRSVPIWASRRHLCRGADPCGRPADSSLSVGQSAISLQKGSKSDKLWLMNQPLRGKQVGITWEDDRKPHFVL